MLHWLHSYITSEPPAWINYSSPCHNTEDALIMTDSQTRQRSKWWRENTHQSPLSLWLHRVTVEWEHLQMRHVSPLHSWMLAFKNSPGQLESTQAYRTQVKWFHVGSQGAVAIPGQAVDGRYILLCSALFLVFQACFITCKLHQGGWWWLTTEVCPNVKQYSTTWFIRQDNQPPASALDNVYLDLESEKEWNNDEL